MPECIDDHAFDHAPYPRSGRSGLAFGDKAVIFAKVAEMPRMIQITAAVVILGVVPLDRAVEGFQRPSGGDSKSFVVRFSHPRISFILSR